MKVFFYSFVGAMNWFKLLKSRWKGQTIYTELKHVTKCLMEEVQILVLHWSMNAYVRGQHCSSRWSEISRLKLLFLASKYLVQSGCTKFVHLFPEEVEKWCSYGHKRLQKGSKHWPFIIQGKLLHVWSVSTGFCSMAIWLVQWQTLLYLSCCLWMNTSSLYHISYPNANN